MAPCKCHPSPCFDVVAHPASTCQGIAYPLCHKRCPTNGGGPSPSSATLGVCPITYKKLQNRNMLGCMTPFSSTPSFFFNLSWDTCSTFHFGDVESTFCHTVNVKSLLVGCNGSTDISQCLCENKHSFGKINSHKCKLNIMIL